MVFRAENILNEGYHNIGIKHRKYDEKISLRNILFYTV